MTKNLDSHPTQSNTVVSHELDNLQSKTDSREAHTAERGTIGQVIRHHRTECGLSLQKLADATGLSKGHVCDLENGKETNPTIGSLYAIAAALQTDIAHLLDISTPHTPETAPVSEAGEHTPGPWLDWKTLEWLYEPQKLLTNTADARLIAAAPELLSALKAILSNHETVGAGASIFQCTTAQVDAARAALSKANRSL